MKFSFTVRLLPKLLLAWTLLAPLRAWPIDPLPADLESAPLEVRSAYREKYGRDMSEARTVVANLRWEKRMEVRRELAKHLQEEASSRAAFQNSPQARAFRAAVHEEEDVDYRVEIAAIVLIFLVVVWIRQYRAGERDA